MRPASSGRAAAARRDHQAGHVHHRGVNGAHWSAGHPRGSVTGAEHPSPFRPRRGRRGLRTLLVRYAQLIPVSGWGLVHRASGSRNVAQRSLGPHLAQSGLCPLGVPCVTASLRNPSCRSGRPPAEERRPAAGVTRATLDLGAEPSLFALAATTFRAIHSCGSQPPLPDFTQPKSPPAQ